MNITEIQHQLSELPISEVRFFPEIGSTNVEAAGWADEGAPDLALVIADTQTAGKGRQGRSWFTPPGAALAFSLVLRQPSNVEFPQPSSDTYMRFTALGAISICQALKAAYALPAEIKWPNDVLLQRRKTAGILTEAHWHGDRLTAVILGIGINIASQSVPPDEAVAFPATCVEHTLGGPVQRLELLRAVLEQLMVWRDRIDRPEFIEMWDQYLAYKGEWVYIFDENNPSGASTRPGRVIGIAPSGQLELTDPSGENFSLITGELRLRPIH